MKLLNTALSLWYFLVPCLLEAQEIRSFTDSRDGKSYKTVILGKQQWMAENLAFNTVEACWVYENDPKNLSDFGYLYSWEAAKRACPTGWHLPHDREWTLLTDYLGGSAVAGAKMKGSSGWNDGGNGTNESGFNGLAGGSRNGNGDFDYLGKYASWWSADQSNSSNAWFRFLYNADSTAYRSYSSKQNALYVRCLFND